MTNLLRTLIYKEEVSLTLIEGSNIVKKGTKIHALSGNDADVFGKTLLFGTYLSSCLKEKTSNVSVSLRGDNRISHITISGNHALHIRGEIGFLANAKEREIEENGFLFNSMTVIRDDGYGMPFVGACEVEKENADASFEEYFQTSEQLPTFIRSKITFKKNGNVESGVMAVAQPLPFASEESISKLKDGKLLEKAVDLMKELELQKVAESLFGELNIINEYAAKYKCNCSRKYIFNILRTLPKTDIIDTIEKEGCIKVHCHYCNTDYIFTKEDVSELIK